jgi:DNA-directed RNA polymerase subunit M/transcription elongation factor TFIIS
MGVVDPMHQAQPLANKAEIAEAADRSSAQIPASVLFCRALSRTIGSVEAHWRLMAEAAAIGVGVLVLSGLFIWATISQRLSVESIVVTIVVLVLSMFLVSQGKTYQRRNLLLQKQAGESVAKTTLAAEIMMDFLREFTLKNQATISQLAESHKVRVIDELRTIIADLGRSVDAQPVRHELTQFEETIARKIMEIPSGVVFPLPRLEYFDQMLQQMQEPERTPKCPACHATQARVSKIEGREGIHYTCARCGYEFSVGITVMLEKHT